MELTTEKEGERERALRNYGWRHLICRSRYLWRFLFLSLHRSIPPRSRYRRIDCPTRFGGIGGKSRVSTDSRVNGLGDPCTAPCLPLYDLICCPLIARLFLLPPFPFPPRLAVYTSFLVGRCHDHCCRPRPARPRACAAPRPGPSRRTDGFQPCNYPSPLN